MAKAQKAAAGAATEKKSLNIWRNRWMYALLIPGFLYFVIFHIIPMWGVLIGFKAFYAGLSFWNSDWVGFQNFIDFFAGSDFWRLLTNTLIISFMNLIFFFPLPIVLSLLLNEIKVQWYKSVLQTFVYVPHFVSMVVIASITFMILKVPAQEGQPGGALFTIIRAVSGKEVNILEDPNSIYWVLLFQAIWKETGWGTVIFLAALAGVDVEQYEAAIVDGANRFQQLIYITIPSILGTIVTMFILRMGSVLNTGFEQIILMQNALNKSKSETFDTYVYNYGRVGGDYGHTTAVGLFKSIVSLTCIQLANRAAKAVGQAGLF